MGRWGDDVFQSDTALDFLHDGVDWISGRIKAALAEDDGGPDQPVLAGVACLRALLAGIPSATRMLKREDVAAWKQHYLAWIEENADDDEQAETDTQIANTEFDALLQLIESD